MALGRAFLRVIRRDCLRTIRSYAWRRRFASKEEEKAEAIRCDSKGVPHCREIILTDNGNENASGSMPGLGMSSPTTRDFFGRDFENFNFRLLQIFQIPEKCLSCYRCAEETRLLS
jgi:hypothetical protein